MQQYKNYRILALSFLFVFLANNDFLRVLDLSWNHLRMRGAMAIGSALQVSHMYCFVILKFVYIRLRLLTIKPFDVAVGKAVYHNILNMMLKVNRHLEKLNISWNGFHIRGALTISKALEINTTLLELNLSCNRLSDGCIQILVNGLKKNSNLKVLRVSNMFK